MKRSNISENVKDLDIGRTLCTKFEVDAELDYPIDLRQIEKSVGASDDSKAVCVFICGVRDHSFCRQCFAGLVAKDVNIRVISTFFF
jgi:hypothetical protein